MNKSLENQIIKHLKGNHNILQEDIENDRVYGWSFWFFENNKIRLDRLYVKPSDYLSNKISDRLQEIMKLFGIKLIIKNAHTYMINPDRCVYEADIYVK